MKILPCRKDHENHACQDGNKRMALVAANMFLSINGYKIQTAPIYSGGNNKAERLDGRFWVIDEHPSVPKKLRSEEPFS